MMHKFAGVRVVLLDIEKFPYALKALPEVLQQKWDDADFAQYKDQFPEEARASPTALEAHVQDLTKRDVKVAYLKNLQGYLWQAGYENGSYTTRLFPDVLQRLQEWHESGISLAIFSSGSVFAQKLLFKHIDNAKDSDTSDGPSDRTGLIKGWFDTVNAGPKLEASSYTKIAAELGVDPTKILFLSDNVKEVTAALEADVPAVLVDRPGNAPLSKQVTATFKLATSLDQISLLPLASTNGEKRAADVATDGPASKRVKDA